MEEYNLIDIAHIYVYYVNSILEENTINKKYNDQSLFTRYNDNSLSLSDFFKSLFLRMSCCLECYIISLIYINRINSAVPGIVNSASVKNIVVSSIVLAQKFFDEICYKSEFYASLGNLNIYEINNLEVDFLCRIHFSLCVFPAEYQTFYTQIWELCKRPDLQSKRVFLPEIVDISNNGACPMLKYVLSPREQQRKVLFYQQRDQQRQQFYRQQSRALPMPVPLIPNSCAPSIRFDNSHPVNSVLSPVHPRQGEMYFPPMPSQLSTTYCQQPIAYSQSQHPVVYSHPVAYSQQVTMNSGSIGQIYGSSRQSGSYSTVVRNVVPQNPVYSNAYDMRYPINPTETVYYQSGPYSN